MVFKVFTGTHGGNFTKAIVTSIAEPNQYNDTRNKSNRETFH
jgi:hypothetical protein